MRQNLFVHFCFPKYLSTSRFYFASLLRTFRLASLGINFICYFFIFQAMPFFLPLAGFPVKYEVLIWYFTVIHFAKHILYVWLLVRQIVYRDKINYQSNFFRFPVFFFVLGRANNRNEVLKQRIFKFVFMEVRVIVLCPRKTIVDLQSVSFLKEN